MSIPVTLRSVKGDTLTFAEMDGNFGSLANANVTITAGGSFSTIVADGSGFTFANTASIGASLSGNILSLTANLAAPGAIGSVTPNTGAFTTVSTTGNVSMAGNYLINAVVQNVREKVIDLGTTSGVITIDADAGSIQTVTVTANVTINTTNLTNFTSGETVSVIITQATNTSLRVLTSNILFAGGSKTLSTANAAIDTMHITYDGARYLASLVKGYA